MGVDCEIFLPPAARIGEVTKVIGILAGNKKSKMELGTSHPVAWSTQVENCDAQSFGANSGLVSCAQINFKDSTGQGRYVMYHFEGGKNGERLLMPPSTGFWIAMGRRLVDFFGGYMIYADCSDSDCDYTQEPRPDIHAEDGDEWQGLQQRIWEVSPLTKKEIKDAIKYSGYGE